MCAFSFAVRLRSLSELGGERKKVVALAVVLKEGGGTWERQWGHETGRSPELSGDGVRSVIVAVCLRDRRVAPPWRVAVGWSMRTVRRGFGVRSQASASICNIATAHGHSNG